MTMGDSEWQGVVQRIKTNESKSNRIIFSLKMKQKANLVPEEFYSVFYAVCNYCIFRIDNLEIGKLMTYIFNVILCVCIMQVVLHLSCY